MLMYDTLRFRSRAASLDWHRRAAEEELTMNALASLVFRLALGASLAHAVPALSSMKSHPVASIRPSVGATHGTAGAVALRPIQTGTLASGTYTTAQADRGKIAYDQSCGTCHGVSLRGGANEFAAPALAGPLFLEKWSGRPLEELLVYASENMPPGQAKLPDTAYLDVTAYVLQVLKYPAGQTELRADSPIMKRVIERQQ
jgi:mono/diheme cytochrome c family protein